MVSTKSQIKKTTDLVVGTIGLSVMGAAAAPLGGLTGTIVRGGVMPMAGMGLMASAAPSGYSSGRGKKKVKIAGW